MGALGVWIYNLAFATGHQRVAAGTGSLFTSLNPAMTFLLAVATGLERPRWNKVAGLVASVLGLYVVVVHGAGKALEAAYVRDALVLMAAPISWACYSVVSKPLTMRHSPLHLNFLVLGIASVPALGLALVDRSLHAKAALWGPGRHVAVQFLALACTVVGFWLWFEALKRVPATTAAAFVFLNAPLTVGFEWLWFDRVPGPAWFLGGAIVLAGVFISTRDRPASEPEPPAAEPPSEPPATPPPLERLPTRGASSPTGDAPVPGAA